MADSQRDLAQASGGDGLTTKYIARLEDENEVLRERVLQLEAQLNGKSADLFPIEFALTPCEGAVLSALLLREQMTKEAVLDAVYGHKLEDDIPELKIIDVYICKIRKKVKPFGIEIDTLWGRGYRLSPKTKDILREAKRLALAGVEVVLPVTGDMGDSP